jgi:hypothetical protein
MSGKTFVLSVRETIILPPNPRTPTPEPKPQNQNPRTGTFLELLQKRDSHKEYDSLGRPMTVPVLREF